MKASVSPVGARSDCPTCGGYGFLVIRPGNSHEEPEYQPCPNPACYKTTVEIKAAFPYLWANDGDTWEDKSSWAEAMRDRYWELRRAAGGGL